MANSNEFPQYKEAEIDKLYRSGMTNKQLKIHRAAFTILGIVESVVGWPLAIDTMLKLGLGFSPNLILFGGFGFGVAGIWRGTDDLAQAMCTRIALQRRQQRSRIQ